MKTIALIPAAVAAALLAGHASPQEKLSSPPKEGTVTPARTVKELQKERIDTLKTVVTVGTKLAQAGRMDVAAVLEDRAALLRAELEAAEKDSDRIPLYTQAIDSLREYEALAKTLHESGRGTEYAVLKVRAKRLELEIALARAKGATAALDRP